MPEVTPNHALARPFWWEWLGLGVLIVGLLLFSIVVETRSAFMERRKEELRDAGKSDSLLYTFVRYDRISPYMRRAVLVAEDNDFYQHGGVDVNAMKEAIKVFMFFNDFFKSIAVKTALKI